ncbi:MAG: serine/threonine protein phosphatase, partial [Clostridia bacterium]|nr:serine/threonine protein phosphatase [Clostridia bacterium]
MQTGHAQNPFAFLESCSALGRQQLRLYSALRDAVPIIDAAIMKLVRLTGGFHIRCTDLTAQDTLDRFFASVNVNG